MYSTNEVSEILKNRGYDINPRTINFYAYDKKMFEIEKGKKTFTEKEIEKIQFIKDLQQYTNYNLSQIKKIINNYSNEKIKEIIEEKISKTTLKASIQGYSSLNNIQAMTTSISIGNTSFNKPLTQSNIKYLNRTTLNNFNYFKYSIILIDNEIIIKTNSNSCNNEKLKEIRSFIEFKLINNKKEENLLNEMYSVKLDNGDLLEFLNIKKYEEIKIEILDFINYKLKK